MREKRKLIWEIKKNVEDNATANEIINILLNNLGLKTKKQRDEFYKPKLPDDISLSEVGINEKSVEKVIDRIEVAKKKEEAIVVYGDYDADGVTATAILWETLHSIGTNVSPFIPDRFSDGYGLNADSIKKIKSDNPDIKLIITVDNGVVANDAVKSANKLGIDVIITDHHEPGETYPEAYALVHSQEIGGAGVAWFLSREISKNFESETECSSGLGLAAIGTVADQIPLLGANRSIVKYGLGDLNTTSRPGLQELYKEGRVNMGEVDTFTIGFVIGPRLNAMGRLEHAIDSLRLLCTKNRDRAIELAAYLGETNKRRQEVVSKVVAHAKETAKKRSKDGIIVIAHETYHEGVVGLAASKLVDEFYRPAIVFSKIGKESKASARSIPGFNIIDAIRKLDDMLLSAGGHPMAAGVKISTKELDRFREKINEVAKEKLTKEVLAPKLRIDLELDLKHLNWELLEMLKEFEPNGNSNRAPLFVTKKVRPWEIRTVGVGGKHLKMKVKQGGTTIDVIGFGLGSMMHELAEGVPIDIAYYFEVNVFRGVKSMQLRLKDVITKPDR